MVVDMEGNKSSIISPGQALLLLMELEKDADKLSQLKKRYLIGIKSSDDPAKVKRELLTEISKQFAGKFVISFDSHTIDADPTRRFFETHLAYESLKHGLDKISLPDLQRHFKTLERLLNIEILNTVRHVLNGQVLNEDNAMYKEYADYLAKITSKEMFNSFSDEKREKISLLVKCAFLGVMNARHTNMPLNIYNLGVYSVKNKGKVMIKNQESSQNFNLGLMKGHMPLARDDIARAESTKPYLKPSDQAKFNPEALWVAWNFRRLVHPFSNSISGTMLCQLRCHAKLRDDRQNFFMASAEKFSLYNQLFISAMLFNSGGHTLFEYTGPFTIDVVQKEFESMPGFEEDMLENMFLKNNGPAFEGALKDTLKYNLAILRRKVLHSDLLQFVADKKSAKMEDIENEPVMPAKTLGAEVGKKRKKNDEPFKEINAPQERDGKVHRTEKKDSVTSTELNPASKNNGPKLR